ncbi:MAG: glycosyltransferase family 4 protein [Bacteroidota bacterium]
MAQFLELLQHNNYSIDHFAISTEKHPFVANQYPPSVKVDHQFISTKVNTVGALGHLVTGKSYHLSRFYQEEVMETLSNLMTEQEYDVVILESLFLATYVEFLRNKTKAKIIVRAHNVEHQIWTTIAENTSSALKRWYLTKAAKSLKKEEVQLLQKVDGIACITQNDLALFEQLQLQKKMTVIPFTLPTQERKSDYSPNDFYHLGSMDWQPNIETVDILVHRIFPQVRAQKASAKLVLAGSKMNVQDYAGLTNVSALGFLDELPTFYASVGVLLSPTQSGSGIRIKIAEALSFGIPVVTTPQGAEGLLENSGTFIAKNDEEFIAKAIELQSNALLRQEMGEAAQQFIQQHYSKESVSLKLDAFLRSV